MSPLGLLLVAFCAGLLVGVALMAVGVRRTIRGSVPMIDGRAPWRPL